LKLEFDHYRESNLKFTRLLNQNSLDLPFLVYFAISN